MSTTSNNFDDSSISLYELLRLLLDAKKKIIIGTLVFAISSVVIALSIPNEFESSSVLQVAESDEGAGSSLSSISQRFGGLASLAGINLSGGGGDRSAFAVELIKSRELLFDIIDKQLVPELTAKLIASEGYNASTKRIKFNPKLYDQTTKEWLRDPPAGRSKIPSKLETHTKYRERLNVGIDEETGFLRINFRHHSPVFAKEFLSMIIGHANEVARSKALYDSTKSLEFLYKQLESTPQSELKFAINQLIESQLNTQMLANVREDYLLRVIDSPYVPELKSYPVRSTLCVIITLAGFMLCIIAVIIQHIYRRFIANP